MWAPVLRSIVTALPEAVLTNEQLAQQFPEWSVEKIAAKTGIHRRHCAEDRCASDLAVDAAERLFERHADLRSRIDYLIHCTQTPDYLLPTTACCLQHRLGLATSCGALDINLGCSGYVYGLGLAAALIQSGQARNVLLLTADTYTRLIDPLDKSARTIFGDGAAATWIEATTDVHTQPSLGPFVYGTDGAGAANLIVRESALRTTPSTNGHAPDSFLRMNGADIYTFTLQAVPKLVQDALERANLTTDDVDHFVFHQANRYMLENLRAKCRIPDDKFVIDLADVGNTVSSSIPIALERMHDSGRIKTGDLAMLVGFGVGYSWAATFVRFQNGVL
jgi:3-oxoacyl-[acyl-carrier-protein] synthase III